MDQSLYSSGGFPQASSGFADPPLDGSSSALFTMSGSLPNPNFQQSSLMRSNSLPLINDFSDHQQVHKADPALSDSASCPPEVSFQNSSNQLMGSSYGEYTSQNSPLAESDPFLRSALHLSNQLPEEMYNFSHQHYLQTPAAIDSTQAHQEAITTAGENRYDNISDSHNSVTLDQDYHSSNQILHLSGGDITPIRNVLTPSSPSVTDDFVVGGKKSRAKAASSVDETDPFSPSISSAAEDEHSMSARVVFQALKTSGRHLSMVYEDLKRQNQLLSLQQRQPGSTSPSPPPSASTPSYSDLPPQISPLSSDMDFLAPPPKRQKLDVAPALNPVPLESAKSAIQELEKLEASKLEELSGLRAKMSAYRSTLLDQQNWLAPARFEQRRTKKLDKQTYEAMYYSLIESVNAIKENYFLQDHPKPEKLSDLAGVIYFVKPYKITKKPPQVGFSFRSYSDSHYTSVERSTPIICKVKEWPADDDTTRCYRLYHFYLGSQRKNTRAGTTKSNKRTAPDN